MVETHTLELAQGAVCRHNGVSSWPPLPGWLPCIPTPSTMSQSRSPERIDKEGG
jgi:hypothetical protein